MSLKRTNIYAYTEDLELIKEAAQRLGVPEAEIIREGVRLAARSTRVWTTLIVTDEESVDLGGPIRKEEIRDDMRKRAGAET